MQRRAERGERRAVGLALHNRPGQQRPRSNLSTLGLGREPRNRLSRSTGAAGVKKRRGPVFLLIDHHGDFRHLARALSKTDAKKRLILRDRTHRSAVPAPVAFMPRSARNAFDAPWSAMKRLRCAMERHDRPRRNHGTPSVQMRRRYQERTCRGLCNPRSMRKEAIFAKEAKRSDFLPLFFLEKLFLPFFLSSFLSFFLSSFLSFFLSFLLT